FACSETARPKPRSWAHPGTCPATKKCQDLAKTSSSENFRLIFRLVKKTLFVATAVLPVFASNGLKKKGSIRGMGNGSRNEYDVFLQLRKDTAEIPSTNPYIDT